MVSQSIVRLSNPLRINGNIIEAYLPDTFIGEICEIHKSLLDSEIIGFAQIIGFNENSAILSLLGDNFRFSLSNALLPTGKPFEIKVSTGLMGSIVDASGHIKGSLTEKISKPDDNWDTIVTNGTPRDFLQRSAITESLATGVKAIDALLTCGRGQRMGIFASAGSGKTTLMNMIIDHSEADVYVIALIGERGREVAELIEELRRSPRSAQIIIVYATSDLSCIERCNAAHIATTISEYFCGQGLNVMLFFDSITRYSRALRDVALSLGELPARRGYPASVFEALPKLLERPGNYKIGSISAFYTVLIENDDESDVVGDEVRSILDGHIYLSRNLASRGHYPAIDVLQSVSRLFSQVTEPEHQQSAIRFRDFLARQKDMQLLLDIGEYRKGENVENDVAFDKQKIMTSFLKQHTNSKHDFAATLEQLYECVG